MGKPAQGNGEDCQGGGARARSWAGVCVWLWLCVCVCVCLCVCMVGTVGTHTRKCFSV